jgi:5-formyltetrahydrofolate cyclo-ligase
VTNPKQLLREQLRKEYALMDIDYKNSSDLKIISHIRDFVLYKKCSRIFIYASTANEINTHDFIREAYAEGMTVLLPKCYSKGIMEFYEYKGNFLVERRKLNGKQNNILWFEW